MKYSSDQAGKQSNSLPDVALESSEQNFSPLPWVGMSRIEMPALWQESATGPALRIPCLVDAQVSLDQKASRGIHMSRLYLSLQNELTEKPLSAPLLRELAQDFLKSHEGLSSRARLAVQLVLPVKRQALKSDYSGWRNYPVILAAEATAQSFRFFVEVRVTYSSTCPASAALSRQIAGEDFLRAFPDGGAPEDIANWIQSKAGMPATPHAQRSEARLSVEIDLSKLNFGVLQLIDLIEETLQTPVQSAVKREDEQEFARRNSQNLMFCEDAARKVEKALKGQTAILDYYGNFQHFESLHPHNAVSFIRKPAGELSSFARTSLQG